MPFPRLTLLGCRLSFCRISWNSMRIPSRRMTLARVALIGARVASCEVRLAFFERRMTFGRVAFFERRIAFMRVALVEKRIACFERRMTLGVLGGVDDPSIRQVDR